ncbi:MAG: hypothetical protein LUD50_07515 [Clostridia bacterium]|nr:hypothetical protein [Clostridia bacterium]
MAVATPTLFRFDVDTDEDKRYVDTERDQYHDSHISERFKHIMDPNVSLDDLFNGADATDMTAPAPVQEETPVQTYSAPQQTMQAGPQLVQSARVTSDLFRVKDTYADPAPAAPAPAAPAVEETFDYATANFEVVGQSTSVPAAPAIEEEENEDLVPTMTTRQYGTKQKMEAGQIENIGAAKKSSIMLSKRDKILMFSIIGIVAVLFVLIIVNAAIISGLNSGLNEAEQAYEATYNEYVEADSAIQDYLSDLNTNMDQYAANLGMSK